MFSTNTSGSIINMPSSPDKQKEHYTNWLNNNRERRRELNKLHREKLVNWLKDLRGTLRCIKCGEDHPACLDFHHRNPDEKFMEIANMVRNCFGIAKILEEISKCDVLCANCHRKLHYDV